MHPHQKRPLTPLRAVWAKDTIFEILGFSSSMDNFKQTRPVAKSFEEK
jgi:hypothetical protein